ncbi:hypothetical protein HAALTHF_10270n [Vreelandella aquamarina]|nr:hypothetical protein HAALTHF_10270n [Halomonas axialensis]
MPTTDAECWGGRGEWTFSRSGGVNVIQWQRHFDKFLGDLICCMVNLEIQCQSGTAQQPYQGKNE